MLGIAINDAVIFSAKSICLSYLNNGEAISHWWAGCAAGAAQNRDPKTMAVRSGRSRVWTRDSGLKTVRNSKRSPRMCREIPNKTFIIAPIDLIKTQMQVQCIGKRMNSDYMGWRGTVRHIYRHAGVKGFTCGFMTCLGWFLSH